MNQTEISRRSFCRWTSSIVLGGIIAGLKSECLWASDRSITNAEDYAPKLIVPATTRNGSHVPVAFKMDHPMEVGHYIRSIRFLNEKDPIPSKGIFYPSSANGEIYFAFQARMHSGTSSVLAIAECNLHGTQTARHEITIPEGQGGCATAGAPKEAADDEQSQAPVIRIPELVRRGRLAKGETTEVQVKFKHPSRTGLAYQDKKFVHAERPLYVSSMQALYGEKLVARYDMTSGLSDNPFLKFKLKFTEEKPLRITFTNSMGREYSAVMEVVLS